jgi:hypothetical protein
MRQIFSHFHIAPTLFNFLFKRVTTNSICRCGKIKKIAPQSDSENRTATRRTAPQLAAPHRTAHRKY